MIARGLGRSYGDAAQVAGGTVIDGRGLGGVGAIDAATGEVTVGAGASIDALLARVGARRAASSPVSPGTRQVTVGGAIAADVHGKNHHRDGAFCEHVTSLRLVDPDRRDDRRAGPRRRTSSGAPPAAMGLTGVVTEATLRLLRDRDRPRGRSTRDRCDDLDALMAAMVDRRRAPPLLGRVGRLHGDRGAPRPSACSPRATTRGATTSRRRERAARSQRAPAPSRLRVPLPAPGGLLNRLSIRAFNEAWFRKAPRHRARRARRRSGRSSTRSTGSTDWNLLYGPTRRRAVPARRPRRRGDDGPARHRAAGRERRAELPRRCSSGSGPRTPGRCRSRSRAGRSRSTCPSARRSCPASSTGSTSSSLAAGGRVYLAKDARLDPARLAAMYPRLGELAALRARLDPHGVLALGPRATPRDRLRGATCRTPSATHSGSSCSAGTSDIARAIAVRLCGERVRTVVLAGRERVAARSRGPASCATPARPTSRPSRFDAARARAPPRTPSRRASRPPAARSTSCVVAVGALGDQAADEDDAARALDVVDGHLPWPVAALSRAARAPRRAGDRARSSSCRRSRACGCAAPTTSTAAPRPGSTRRASAWPSRCAAPGVTLQVLRPGFVRSKMTEGLADAPFSTDVDAVADVAVAGLVERRDGAVEPAGAALRVRRPARSSRRRLWRRLPG